MRDRSLEVFSARGLKEPEALNHTLIRASLSNIRVQVGAPDESQKKTPPPENTDAESFYYLKQMRARTPMAVVLTSGETLHGVIEWYDQRCIKLTRAGEPNLLIMKNTIRYLYKQPSSMPSQTEPAAKTGPGLAADPIRH
jgi:sRNA-binding regulator protein Hfq